MLAWNTILELVLILCHNFSILKWGRSLFKWFAVVQKKQQDAVAFLMPTSILKKMSNYQKPIILARLLNAERLELERIGLSVRRM